MLTKHQLFHYFNISTLIIIGITFLTLTNFTFATCRSCCLSGNDVTKCQTAYFNSTSKKHDAGICCGYGYNYLGDEIPICCGADSKCAQENNRFICLKAADTQPKPPSNPTTSTTTGSTRHSTATNYGPSGEDLIWILIISIVLFILVISLITCICKKGIGCIKSICRGICESVGLIQPRPIINTDNNNNVNQPDQPQNRDIMQRDDNIDDVTPLRTHQNRNENGDAIGINMNNNTDESLYPSVPPQTSPHYPPPQPLYPSVLPTVSTGTNTKPNINTNTNNPQYNPTYDPHAPPPPISPRNLQLPPLNDPQFQSPYYQQYGVQQPYHQQQSIYPQQPSLSQYNNQNPYLERSDVQSSNSYYYPQQQQQPPQQQQSLFHSTPEVFPNQSTNMSHHTKPNLSKPQSNPYYQQQPTSQHSSLAANLFEDDTKYNSYGNDNQSTFYDGSGMNHNPNQLNQNNISQLPPPPIYEPQPSLATRIATENESVRLPLPTIDDNTTTSNISNLPLNTKPSTKPLPNQSALQRTSTISRFATAPIIDDVLYPDLGTHDENNDENTVSSSNVNTTSTNTNDDKNATQSSSTAKTTEPIKSTTDNTNTNNNTASTNNNNNNNKPAKKSKQPRSLKDIR